VSCPADMASGNTDPAYDSDRGDWEPPAFSSEGPSNALTEHNGTAILVVDDQEALRVSVAEVLRCVGYTVIESADGLDALRLLGTMRFDAMVLDLRMPRLSGSELLAALPKPPPTVVLSAHRLDDADLARFDPVVCAQLRKPVPPQRLIDAVAAATAS
jgi:CheY-like chemotaxis protein